MYPVILVPIDDTTVSEAGLAEATAIARQLGSALRLVHVVDPRPLRMPGATASSPERTLEAQRQEARQFLAAAAARVRKAGIVAEPVVLCNPARSIGELIVDDASASGAKLIVMGTHGQRGSRPWMLGSDTEDVLRRSRLPVLVVRESRPDAGAVEAQPRGEI